ncbi:spermatogenesis associated 21 [Phyllostomus discolor]|uniref:Spermatogenesis associated 21 n=1 Tax=Phyllostomus discolor TaxID=89673 RepID=A0A834AB98_9CHIR|nr:spermatogenesis associated 21 [Phyllostomus discolor]
MGTWPRCSTSCGTVDVSLHPLCASAFTCVTVVFPDAAGMDSGKEPPSASERPEERPGHREASEEGLLELRTPEQSHLVDPGKKLSSWVPQEEPKELQGGQDRTKPGNELGALPSRVPAAPEGLQRPGSAKEPEDLQGRQQNPGPVEGQAPKRCQQQLECQPAPGHQAADGSDTVQPIEPSCTLDSYGQQWEDKPPKQAGTPHVRPQGPLPEPGPQGDKDSSQESMPLMASATPEEKTDNAFPPSVPGPDTPKDWVKAVEPKPTPGPAPPPEARDTGERKEPDWAQTQPQEPTATAGVQNQGSSSWQSFMKCLLEVEEEEATQRRAPRARALPSRKSPRTLTPVSTSASSLPLTLPQTPASAPTAPPSWARPPAPGPAPAPAPAPVGAPAPASAPGTVLPAPAPEAGWRKAALLHQGGERGLSHAKARQELEEGCPLQLPQNWEELVEEHLTLKQEEAFHSYFEIFSGHGEVDARSLESVLLLVGISLTPAQVEEALMSADVDGDGHVGFKDFLAVMTDTKRFFCSVEQNASTDVAPPNPHTLLFEILSLLVEMLALPEAALEEITNYYQKKLKEGTGKTHEMESAIGRLRSRKKLPYNPQLADTLEVPERRVLRILSRLKQQNYAANLQSPYAQVPCVPLCPRLDKMVGRKQGSHYVLDQCNPIGLGSDIHSLLIQPGSRGSRDHSSGPARTH